MGVTRSYLVGNLRSLGRLRRLSEEQEGRCQYEKEGDNESLKVRHAQEHQITSHKWVECCVCVNKLKKWKKPVDADKVFDPTALAN